MRSLPIILLMGLFLLGCVNPKSERNINFIMEPSELIVLKAHCEEINSHGDILLLLQEIKRDSKEVLQILEVPGKGARAELSELAARISENSRRISHLSKSEWTTERWQQEVVWRIDEEDFSKSIGTYFDNGFSILNASIESLYLMGLPRDDLNSKFSIEHEGNVVLVKYKSLGSSLELCQLQKTLIVILDVYTRSVKARKHQYFSLNVHY
jgi:hypothetical protein